MSSVMRFDTWQDSNGNPVASGVGGTFTAPGSVLQVVSTTKTDTFSTTSTSFVDVTGVSISITPTFTSSKILVFVSGVAACDTANLVRLNLLRDSTNLSLSTGGSTRNQTTLSFPKTVGGATPFSIGFLDSPSTTSATTYKLQLAAVQDTVFVNRQGVSTDDGATTTITLMEIAG